jgi:hypothetical protein
MRVQASDQTLQHVAGHEWPRRVVDQDPSDIPLSSESLKPVADGLAAGRTADQWRRGWSIIAQRLPVLLFLTRPDHYVHFVYRRMAKMNDRMGEQRLAAKPRILLRHCAARARAAARRDH